MPEMQLYDYQQAAVRLLEETRENLLVIAPTGAGKTLVAWKALELAGRGAYIGPTRTLMREKFVELNGIVSANGQTVRIGNKDYSLSRQSFQEADFAILSPWKLEMLMVQERDFARVCPVVAIDEAHGLEPDTEFIYTILKVVYPEVRRLALSATIHEDDEAKFASWLDAVVVKSEDRPVPLIERVIHFDANINDDGEEVTNMLFLEAGNPVDELVVPRAMDDFGQVAATVEYIREQGDDSPILIFTPSRNHSAHLAREFTKIAIDNGAVCDPELQAIANSLPWDASDYTQALRFALPYRIGVHNGGLTQQERELVEDLAVQGKLDIIVTCYTLEQGINLPARHIIFASLYDYGDDGQKRLMPVSTFRQIQGRAGRPQYDTVGYSWCLADSEVALVEILEVLLKYKASKVESRIYNEYFLTAKVPLLVHLGFNTPEKLAGFMQQTFWGQTLQDLEPIIHQFEKIFENLVEDGFIGVLKGKFVYLTSDGQRLARLGVHPNEYQIMRDLYKGRNTDYTNWVGSLAVACCEYVLGHYDKEAIDTVVTYGLTVYAQRGMGRIRELADYVSRLLDISRSYFQLEAKASTGKDREFIKNWQEQVRDKFATGQLEVAQALKRVLDRSQLKRIIRNLGAALTDRESFISNEKVLKSFVRVLWGSDPFVDAAQVGKVASALGIEDAPELFALASDQWFRVKKGLPMEDPESEPEEEADEEEVAEELTEAEKIEAEFQSDPDNWRF